MSAYTEEVLVEKLNKLNDSLQSIQTLSHWIMYHRKRYKQSVAIWERELYKVPNTRKLLFLYLANDILQISRKKGEEFVGAFSKIMEPAFTHAWSKSAPEHQRKLMRLLDVWEQRQVFGAGFVRDIKNALQGGAAVGDKRKLGEWSKPANSLSLDSSSPSGLETNIVSKALSEQAQASLAVRVLEEKVSSLPDLFNGDDSFLNDVQSQTELREVATEANEACDILQQYSKQLEADLERRSKLISLLTDMIAEQENAMRQTSLDLSQSQDRLKNAEHLRSKITELMGKLPLEPGSPSQSAFVASFLSSDGDINNTSGTNGNDDDAYDPTTPSHMTATATSKSPTTPPTTPPGSPPLTDTNEQPFHSQKKARLGETSSVLPTPPSSSGSETTSSVSSASTSSPSLTTAPSASFPLMSSSMAAATPTTTTTPTSIFDLAGSGYVSLLSAYGWPASSSIAATTGQQAYIPGMSLPVSYQSGGLSSYLSSTAATSVSTTAPTPTSATSATSEGSSSMTWS